MLRMIVIATAIGAVCLTAGCIGALDILAPTKDLPGGFRLVQFEGSSYYIQRGSVWRGSGVLGGPIERIGWNADAIVAWRSAMKGSGWMIIDVHDGHIDGPISEEDLQRRMVEDRRLHGISVRPVREAWRIA